MASSTFVLKEPNSENETLVYLIFRYHNQRFKYSTGQKIHPKFWNPEKQKAVESTRFEQYPEFNSLLRKIDGGVHTIYRKLINDNEVPTRERLRTGLDTYLLKNEIRQKSDLIGFVNDFIETSPKKSSTKRHYRQTLRLLREFKSSFSRSLTFENIDLGFYDEFLSYCQNRNYAKNTIGSFIKNIKAFMNAALDRKLTSNTEFRNRKFRKVSEASENIYLTREEINQLYSLNLADDQRLDKVRDTFIIGCYTGLRYSDLIHLSEENLIDDRTKLKIKTAKTGELVIIPLHKYIRDILKKYNGIPLYQISNQKMNEYLKDLGKKAAFNDAVLISCTKGGDKQSEAFKKWELITVHTARRSFATNAFLMGIPPISIMKITGHRTERAFLQYIKISQEENANKLINHPFFK